VIENGPPAQTDLTAGAPAARPAPANERVVAGRLRNPSLTVPQGTVIAAVLETALDSTRPGGARAIVQRDVMGFDGTRVLIPRGSRLYGEYQSDVTSGQKRALIRWTRLTRPDAVIVNLDSPSADPLGRAGVEGKVNSHFFARFGGAILQSVLNAGVGIATSAALKNGAFVALPGTAAQAVPNLQPQQIQPTLKVRQGTSVSVFVARDLDFSSVEQ
jgi:type IV secretion system protein VirB10